MKKKILLKAALFVCPLLFFAACGEKENGQSEPSPAPSPDYSDNPYFIVSNDSVSIFSGDSVINDGQYVATCRFVEDTAFYEIYIGAQIEGSGIRRPAVMLDLRYDDINFWQHTRSAMYEDFAHASALTEENGGTLTFDWLGQRTIKSVVDGYDRETNTLSLVMQCDMFNLYELYFGGENKRIDNVQHKTVTIALTNVTFIPLGF